MVVIVRMGAALQIAMPGNSELGKEIKAPRAAFEKRNRYQDRASAPSGHESTVNCRVVNTCSLEQPRWTKSSPGSALLSEVYGWRGGDVWFAK
jgi:hypothetical protein